MKMPTTMASTIRMPTTMATGLPHFGNSGRGMGGRGRPLPAPYGRRSGRGNVTRTSLLRRPVVLDAVVSTYRTAARRDVIAHPRPHSYGVRQDGDHAAAVGRDAVRPSRSRRRGRPAPVAARLGSADPALCAGPDR